MEINNKKKCFFITPVGEDDSETRKNADGLIDNVLTDVLNGFDMEIICSHRVNNSDTITDRIVENILTCELAIADLTGLNPNVKYELGVRHAIEKHVICIAEKGTKLPFDTQDFRTIFYTNEISSVGKLKNELKERIETIMKDSNIRNPVANARKLLDKDSAKGQFVSRDELENALTIGTF